MDTAQPYGYKIAEELGRGPLAVVYRARREGDDQAIALKVTRPGLVRDASLFARLSREVEVLNLLQQPGILPVLGINEQDGQIQIAMPVMAGGNLLTRLEAGHLSLDSVVELAERLAKALDAAHTAGILHLDLKPSNVLFDEENQAWLSDFSGHKLAQACLEPGPYTLYGPLAYSSPEQLQSTDTVDERADNYALGALLYHMLAGQPPFYSENALGYFVQHQNSALPPLPEHYPTWLYPIFAKAMAHDPQLRYQSASALAADLRIGLQGSITELSVNTPQQLETTQDNSSNLFRPQIHLEEAVTRHAAIEKNDNPRDYRSKFHDWVWVLLLVGVFAIGSGLLLNFVPGIRDFVVLRPVSQLNVETPGSISTNSSIIEQVAISVTSETPTPATPTPPKNSPTSTSFSQGEISSQATNSLINTPISTLSSSVITSSVPLTYTLQYNEKLFLIAAKYQLDLGYLIAVNNLKCDSRLYPNKILQLPPSSQDKFPGGFQLLSIDNFLSLQWERILECVKNVSELSFSPDGSTLAVAQDNDIYLWKVGDWIPFKLLSGHLSKISSIAYASDGKLLASAANDLKIRLWSMEDYSNIVTINAHGSEIKNIAFSPDNKRLVSTSTDLTVKIWDIPSGKLLHQMRGYKAYGAAWSPDGSLLAIGYGDSLRVYQASDYSLLFSLPSPDVAVHELAFSPDGSLLASSADIWHVGERKHIYHMENSVNEVNFTFDGRMLLVGVKGWRISNGSRVGGLITPLEESPRTQYAQENVALSPDGSLLAWGNQDGVTIWGTHNPSSTPDPNLYLVQSGDTYPNIAEKFHLSLRDLLAQNDLTCTNEIFIGQPLNTALENVENYSLMQIPVFAEGSSNKLEKIKDVPDPTCTKDRGIISFSPDGLSLASGGTLWRLTRNSLLVLETNIFSQAELEEGVRTTSPAMAFSPDGSIVAIRSDKKIKLYDLTTGRLIRTLEGHTDKIAGLAFSPDGSILASGSSTVEQAINLWSVADGSLVRTINGIAAQKFTFTADGEILISTWEDDTLRFWNVADGMRFGQNLTGIMGRAVISSDGYSIAFITCSKKSGVQCDKEIINIYDVKKETVYRTLPGLQDHIQDVIWSPDGAHILVASEYAVLEWDVETSKLIRTLDPGPIDRRTIKNLYLTPGNDFLLAVTEDDIIYFWDFNSGALRFTQRINHDYIAFSPLDNIIAFASAGQVSLWQLP